MEMSNLGLQAFYETARCLHMTQAAQTIGVTQSALSQRIHLLEDTLESTLFIREGKKLKHTQSGVELLQYCQQIKIIEDEFLSNFKSHKGQLSGIVRIASYSSIMRSLILPRLARFSKEHPNVMLKTSCHEVKDLYPILKNNSADIVISDHSLPHQSINQSRVGSEEYVLIENNQKKLRNDVYLDHDENDDVTDSFFQIQNNPPTKYRKSYMGEIYAILEAVELGMGRAVMSKHLIKNRKVKIIKGYKSLIRPIYIQYHHRTYYPENILTILKYLSDLKS